MFKFNLFILFISLFSISQCSRQIVNLDDILIIGHRGSPYYLPEHSLGSYALAIRQNVDYIEPDIQLTKDNKIICMHDLELSDVTDVASRPEFADRKKRVVLTNGLIYEGWFADSFTLEEIKTLYLTQRGNINRDPYYDSLFRIVTLEEAIDLLHEMNEKLNLSVGIYIEPKHSTYFASMNLTYDDELIRILKSKGYVLKGPEAKKSKLIIECFEKTQLRRLREHMDVTFVQLVSHPLLLSEDTLEFHGSMLTKEGIKEISEYADAVGMFKRYLYDFDEEFMTYVKLLNGTLYGKELIDEIHKHGMTIHPWTSRNRWEEPLLDEYMDGDEMEEYRILYEYGVDGLFTESPEVAWCAREIYVKNQKKKNIRLILSITIPIITCVLFLMLGLMIGRTYFSKYRGESAEVIG